MFIQITQLYFLIFLLRIILLNSYLEIKFTYIHDVLILGTCPHQVAPFLCREIVFVLAWIFQYLNYAL